MANKKIPLPEEVISALPSYSSSDLIKLLEQVEIERETRKAAEAQKIQAANAEIETLKNGK